jgi:Secretion system C-terminal sorting domain
MTKRFTFLLSFSLVVGSIFGQYEPMALEGAHWVLEAWSDTPGHHAFSIRGDSVINSVTYKKVYWQQLQGQIGQELESPFLVLEEKLFGLLRDDLAGKKVFFIPFEDYSRGLFACEKNEEQLLYDFSIQPGSFAPLCTQYDENSLLEIDSVASGFLWGKDRRLQYIVNGSNGGLLNPPGMFVEGIGTSYGPFTSGVPILIFGAHLKLVEYCLGTDEECGFGIINSTSEASEIPIKVFPNPANDLLHLDIPPGCMGKALMSISDMGGKTVVEKTFQLHGTETEEVQTGHLPKGIYILRLTTTETDFKAIFSKL